MITFQIYEHSYKDKKYILDVKSKGKVESTKYFPVFENYDKEYIFKPLSKTKPLLTPLFAYSEVYWSYLINKYIDNSTPRYRIATCKGLSDEQKKYQDKGTIVANVLGKDEKLINLLELYRKYPDSTVNIDDYTNYCEVQYNYEDILNSTFFEMRKDLRAKLCLQILCSVLRRDANYHYENVSFIEKDGKIVDIAPMIDMEFSEMFLYPDKKEKHESRFSQYDEGMSPIFDYDGKLSYEENYELFKSRILDGSIYDRLDRYHFSNLLKNLRTIVKLHPEVVREFLRKISLMKHEIGEINIHFNREYIDTFSSDDYKLGIMKIKEHKDESNPEYQKVQKEIKQVSIDEEEFNQRLKREVLWNIEKIEYVLHILLDYYEGELLFPNEYSNETLYKPVKHVNEDIMNLIFTNIDKKYIKTDKDL